MNPLQNVHPNFKSNLYSVSNLKSLLIQFWKSQDASDCTYESAQRGSCLAITPSDLLMDKTRWYRITSRTEWSITDSPHLQIQPHFPTTCDFHHAVKNNSNNMDKHAPYKGYCRSRVWHQDWTSHPCYSPHCFPFYFTFSVICNILKIWIKMAFHKWMCGKMLLSISVLDIIWVIC